MKHYLTADESIPPDSSIFPLVSTTILIEVTKLERLLHLLPRHSVQPQLLLHDAAHVSGEPASGEDTDQGCPGSLPASSTAQHPVPLPLLAQATTLLSKLSSLPGVSELGWTVCQLRR